MGKEKNYSGKELREMVDRIYYDYLRHMWDPENGYYRGDGGDASVGGNSMIIVYHLVAYLQASTGRNASSVERAPAGGQAPAREHAHRIRSILGHLRDSWDRFGTGGLFDFFDKPEMGSSARGWIARETLIALSLVLKHGSEIGVDGELLALVKDRFERCFNVTDRLFWGMHGRDNQDVASYFAVLGFAYWTTGEERFLSKAREAAGEFDRIYTRDDPRSIREIHRGCYPDWTWNYAQSFDVFESGGATHSPTYENAHFGFWLLGNRMFALGGVRERPWVKDLARTARACLLSSIASNGFCPYVIEAYVPSERFQPASQQNISVIYAGWAAACPEALPDPGWTELARFFVDRAVDSVKRVSDASGLLPKSLELLSEHLDERMTPSRLSNNLLFIYWVSLLLQFGALDEVPPSIRPYWDWRWFWDLVHVRGRGYDAHLAGWTNRSREHRGTHRGHPPESWVDPMFVGGSVARLFTSHGGIVFPFSVDKFGWKVETRDGILDSSEACMGRPGRGYDFWIEVDGRRIPRPPDYGELDAGTGFDAVKTHWRVTWEGCGEMIIENTFTADRIAVRNLFVPEGGSVGVKRLIQPLPFTQVFDRILVEPGSGAMGSTAEVQRIEWRRMFEKGCRRFDLARVARIVLLGGEAEDAEEMVIVCEREGELILNTGMLFDKWPAGWNYLEMVKDVSEAGMGPWEQSYTISVKE